MDIFDVESGFMCYMIDGMLRDSTKLDPIEVFIIGNKMYPFYFYGLKGDAIKYQMFINSWIGVELK